MTTREPNSSAQALPTDALFGESGVIRMGGWRYAPPSPRSATATLHGNGDQVVALRPSAKLVQNPLACLKRIESVCTAAVRLPAASSPHDGQRTGDDASA